MNNSKFAIENVVLTNEDPKDRSPELREREQKLIHLIQNLQTIQKTDEWSSLKTELFDSLTKNLIKEIESEARKEEPNTLKLNRLSGELKWAEKYSDLSKLEQIKRVELTQVRQLLYGKTQENPGS